MRTNELFILIGGSLSFINLMFHCFFYRFFNWKSELGKIQLSNHRIFMSIHIGLIILLATITFLSFLYFREMASCNGIAFALVICCSVFWFWRVMWQIIYFKIPKNIEKTPILHYSLILLYGLLFISYTIPIIIKLIN